MTELEKLRNRRDFKLRELNDLKGQLAYYKERVEKIEMLIFENQQVVNALNAKIVEAELRGSK